MARRARNNRNGRDAPPIASRPRLPVSAPPRPVSLAPVTFLRPRTTPQVAAVLATEDRRLHHPLGPYRPAVATVRAATRTVARDRPSGAFFGSQTKAVRAFAVPTKVALCVRRKRRKEVIHAKGIAGGKVRKPRRTYFSQFSCR